MDVETCWEYWGCPNEKRDRCPAYTVPGSGRDCFDLAKDFCSKIADEFKYCWECPWYKKIKSTSDKAEKK